MKINNSKIAIILIIFTVFVVMIDIPSRVAWTYTVKPVDSLWEISPKT